MKKLLLILTSIVILSSCASHGGFMTDSASLGTNNFTYPKMNLKGEAKATYFFGIGGLSKTALVDEAKENLLFGNELQANQTLANITVNWKSTFFLIGWSNKCIVTADIVEFK